MRPDLALCLAAVLGAALVLHPTSDAVEATPGQPQLYLKQARPYPGRGQ